MVSFCIKTLFFLRGKREVDYVPSHRTTRFVQLRMKTIYTSRGKNTTTHSHRPVRRAARPTKNSLFLREMMRRPFCWTSSSRSRMLFFSSRLLLRFFDDDDDSDAMRSDVRDDDILRNQKAPRDACHYQHTTRTTRGCTLRRPSWRGGMVHKICVPFFVKKNNTETFLIITKGKRREREQQRKNHRR